MSKNVNIRNLTGEHGGKVLGAGDSVTGVEYGVIVCVTDTTLTSIASNVDQSSETIGTGLTFLKCKSHVSKAAAAMLDETQHAQRSYLSL